MQYSWSSRLGAPQTWQYMLRSSGPWPEENASGAIVRIKSPAGLTAQIAGVHHLDQQRARTVLRIAEAVGEHPQDIETDVQTDQVGQSQRTHRMVHSKLHNLVDRFGLPDPLVEAINGLVDHRHEDAVGDEPRRVVDLD